MTQILSGRDSLKARQHSAWSAGDYAVVGSTLQTVGEQLYETLDLRAGQRVLDVAAGNGNASLAAARRWCEVTSTDFVPALIARALPHQISRTLGHARAARRIVRLRCRSDPNRATQLYLPLSLAGSLHRRCSGPITGRL